MSKTICSKCRYAIQDIPEMFCMFRKLHTKDGYFENCHCFFPKSVFDRITSSPEVLAENFIHKILTEHDEYKWRGEIGYINWKSAEFDSKEEAIAATVAKLKEVCDE